MAELNKINEVTEHELSDFRYHLQNELLRRCRKNRNYSMRAFARSLRLDSSALSKILHGKRGISKRMLKRLGENLGLTPEEMVRFRATHGNQIRTTSNGRNFELLSLDTFQFVSNWYYYAILSLMDVEGFDPDVKWIARSLGLSVSEVRIALERLERLGFIELRENGSWATRGNDLTTVGNDFSAPAFRALQKQLLEKAIEALERVPMEERDQTSITMAIDSSLLPKAKNRIKKFRRELRNYLQSSNKYDRVYTLGLSLYPVSHSGSNGADSNGANDDLH